MLLNLGLIKQTEISLRMSSIGKNSKQRKEELKFYSAISIFYSTKNLYGLLQRSFILSEGYCLPKMVDTPAGSSYNHHYIYRVKIAREEVQFK
jgi:hypothetical protein